MSTTRWVLLLPAVLAVFYGAVAIAIGIYLFAGSLCPVAQLVEGNCTAPYLSALKESLLLVVPPIAAALMILTAAKVAPANKWQVALITFVLGSLAALYYAFDEGYWVTFVLTELCALAVLLRIYRKRFGKATAE